MTHATLLLHNANVFTADPDRPRAEAVALHGNRIVFAGSNIEAKRLAGPSTRLIDARGRTVLPGFIDSHFHLVSGAVELRSAQLQEIRTLEELARALQDQAAKNPHTPWVTGIGLIYRLEPGGLSPTRHDLDKMIPDRPVYVEAYDGHTAWVNTEALRRADLLNGRDVGAFGKVVVDADGLATGELREPPACQPVFDLIPKPTAQEKHALLRRAMQMAASHGLTSVHNMNGDLADLELLAALERAGEMLLRIYMPLTVLPEHTPRHLNEAVGMREQFPGGLARGGLVKFFMDGVIESYTGLLLDDYAGQPSARGAANFEIEHFTELALEADRLGLQIAVHCTGDGAVRRVLDTYELLRARNGPRDARHRIEHIELVGDEDRPRFAALNVIAAMQPAHRPTSASGADLWPERVGPQRFRRSFAWRALRDAGARLAFGSDWTVASMNPMTGIHAALAAPLWQAGDPPQRQTLEETLLSYTRDAAYAEFKEHEKGILKEGYLADVVMLSEDIFQTPPEEILRVQPDLTICDGRITHET